jgi:hypothetical protein
LHKDSAISLETEIRLQKVAANVGYRINPFQPKNGDGELREGAKAQQGGICSETSLQLLGERAF